VARSSSGSCPTWSVPPTTARRSPRYGI